MASSVPMVRAKQRDEGHRGVLGYEEGSVDVFGTLLDSDRAAEQVKRRIGFLPRDWDSISIPNFLSRRTSISLPSCGWFPRRTFRRAKARLLSITRLDRFRSRLMKQLSGGMKQKLGLICTLIHEPELAILDEPTTGVDPVSRRDFWAILAEWQAVKGHDRARLDRLHGRSGPFHRLSFLSHGRVLASGTPADVQSLVPGLVVTFESTPQPRSG